jgi:hypothetical protein
MTHFRFTAKHGVELAEHLPPNEDHPTGRMYRARFEPDLTSDAPRYVFVTRDAAVAARMRPDNNGRVPADPNGQHDIKEEVTQ